MKTMQRVFRWLFRSETKNQKPCVEEKAGDQPADDPKKQRPEPFTDDSSPPGFKIRWHH